MHLQKKCYDKEDDTIGPYLGQHYGTGRTGSWAPEEYENKSLLLFLASTYAFTRLEFWFPSKLQSTIANKDMP